MSKVLSSKSSQLPEGLLVALKTMQDELGHLPESVIQDLSREFGVPVSDVYGVATFYSFLSTRPRGKNIIRICKSMPCYLKKYGTVVDAIARELGIKPGETTPDGRFSFELTNCIGLCDQAPAMLINNDAHVNLTPDKIARVLNRYQ